MSDNMLRSPHEEIGSEYGASYLDWKSWEAGSFGALRKSQEYYFDAEIKKANIELVKTMRVLEIGFGNGSFLAYAKRKRWDVAGTEVNKDLVDTARHHNFNAIHADNLSAFADDTFDLVVAFDVLEHVSQDDLLGFLREVNRVLKGNGTFIARFPNGDSPFGLLNQNGDMTHITSIGSGKARYLANKLGARLVFIGGEAQPLIAGTLRRTLHSLFALPIKKIINLFVNLVFFQGANIAFCSLNLVMIIRASKPAPSRI